jgi:hypothetical protein
LKQNQPIEHGGDCPMKKWIVLLLVIAPFFYANYKKPLILKHQQKIYQVAVGPEVTVDEMVYEMPQWEGLEFIDWKFVTATQDKSKQSLVSFGIVNYIKVVDKEWAPRVFEIKPTDASGGTK